MAPKNAKTDIAQITGTALPGALKEISEKCINCALCQKECAFLRKYGKPKEIADSYDPFDRVCQGMPFECSLCQLCASVCPVKVNPSAMFLEMRRDAVRRGSGDYPEHAGILGYEKRGTSKRYTFYALPPDCDTIFFPGCTLPGARPDTVIRLYEHMKKSIPSLGIVLDCCTKPSHDLGREIYFGAMFGEMKEFLLKSGVLNVIVACAGCYKVFKNHGDEISVTTVYTFMEENGMPQTGRIHDTVSIHDPCAVRFEESLHASVRNLSERKGLVIDEMPHNGARTLCCGEGGSVECLSPELARNWGLIRKEETDGRRMVTYCAGCANYLGSFSPTSHILDLLFEPEAALSGTLKISKAPFTYLNRIKLKHHLKQISNGALTRERSFTAAEDGKKGGLIKRWK